MPQPQNYFGLMGGAENIGGVSENIMRSLFNEQNRQGNQNTLDAAARAEEARKAMVDIVLGGSGQQPPAAGAPAGAGSSLVATPEQEAQSRALETQFPDAPKYANDAPEDPFVRLARADPAAAAALRTQMQQRAQLQAYYANPTARGTMQLLTSQPQLAEQVTKSWEMYTGAAKEAKLSLAADAYNRMRNGDFEGAAAAVQSHLDADAKAGLDTTGYPELLQEIRTNPKAALGHAGLLLATGAGPEKFAEAYGKVGERERADELQPSQMRKAGAEATSAEVTAQYAPATAQSQLDTAAATRQRMAAQSANEQANTNIASGRLALDVEKATADIDQRQQEIEQKFGQLTGPAEKIVNDSSAAAAVAVQTAARAQDLADRFKAANMGASYKARGAELWKQIAGSQDAYTQMRAEWQQMRNKGALANRAEMPGSMSDADREFLLQGFPRDDANPAYIARWLGTMARASTAVAKQEDSKAEWVAQNGNLGPTRRDIVVDGHRVPKGMTFSQQQALQRKMLPQGVPALAEDIAARAAK